MMITTDSLNTRKFMLAWGLAFGLLFLVMGLLATFFGIGIELVDMASQMYIGYEPTFIGSVIGGIWGYVEGTILGLLIAYLYNRL